MAKQHGLTESTAAAISTAGSVSRSASPTPSTPWILARGEGASAAMARWMASSRASSPARPGSSTASSRRP